jgi:predicted dehydrogenase
MSSRSARAEPPLRAAVVGCGVIGAGTGAAHPDVGVGTHADAYTACVETVLAAVCDADAARAAACADRYGAVAYSDLETLLAQARPELVSVCTPDATHADVLALVLDARGVRGVLAEKPLALTAAEGAALAALAAERDIVLAVNYSRRFAPPVRALRDAIAGGAIGELQHVHGTYVKGLRHNGTHWLDLLRMLAGEPVRVRGWERLADGGEDPTLDAELTLAGGAGVRLAGLDTQRFTLFEMELIGTHGRARVLEAAHALELWGVADDPRYPGYRALQLRSRVQRGLHDALLHAVRDLVRCVTTGGEPACTGADGVAALALADAIRASAAAGGGDHRLH